MNRCIISIVLRELKIRNSEVLLGGIERILIRSGWIILFLFPMVLFGQSADLLVSPGKLSRVHSHLTGINKCVSCHTEKKKADPLKCLSCHKDLAQRINSKRGFHKDKKEDCITCHPEHQGEDFKLIDWNPKEFDHSETGYILTGLHKKITDCNKCHSSLNRVPGKKSKTYLLQNTQCGGCHPDAHKGQLGKACDKCHSVEIPFKQVTFNHDKAKFSLKGAHQRVECIKCHKEKQWTGLRFNQCGDCHKDPHQPSFGSKCTSCHNENSWKTSNFDHDRTAFPLKGKHRSLVCTKCHGVGDKTRKIPFTFCTDCHKKDPHAGQFSKDCSACHVVEGFEKVLYNHDNTRFPLTGKHKKVSCKKCHYTKDNSKVVVYKPLGLKCIECHRDIHIEQFTKGCDVCHSTDGFKSDFLKFDHQKDTQYPLQGKHASVTCEKCHKKKTMKFPGGFGEAVLFKPMLKSCDSCHEDFHRGQLGSDCGKCHGLETFKQVKGFDHEKTRFSLKGFHADVACIKCHPRTLIQLEGKKVETMKFKPLDMACLDCHRGFDHSKTEFPLTGKHMALKCDLCHNEKSPNTAKTRKTTHIVLDCSMCHPSPHPGSRKNCTDCHNTKTWKLDPW